MKNLNWLSVLLVSSLLLSLSIFVKANPATPTNMEVPDVVKEEEKTLLRFWKNPDPDCYGGNWVCAEVVAPQE